MTTHWNRTGTTGEMLISLPTSDTYSVVQTWNEQDERWDWAATRHLYQGGTESLGKFRTTRAAKVACENKAAFR